MTNEVLDTTNKLIKPGNVLPSDNAVIKQLSDSLQDITPEDVNTMCDEMDEAKAKEEMESLQELLDYRKVWEERIRGIDDKNKEKIINAVKSIPLSIKIDKDGNRCVVFKLLNKTYKILDPRLEANSDYKYRYYHEYLDRLMRGMRGDNVDKWENQKLKEYVKKKQGEGLHIANEDELKELLGYLGKKADLNNEEDQIAMLMYLTGMNGYYWMGESGEGDDRFLRGCHAKRGFTDSNDHFWRLVKSISLCMITCE